MPLPGIECRFSSANRNFQGSRMIGHIGQRERQPVASARAKNLTAIGQPRPSVQVRDMYLVEGTDS